MKYLLLSIALVGCGPNDTGITSADLVCDQTLTYASFGQAFIDDYCLECHDGDEDPRLSTQAQVQMHSSKILRETVFTDAMPEDGDLTLEERQMLGNWIECGAP